MPDIKAGRPTAKAKPASVGAAPQARAATPAPPEPLTAHDFLDRVRDIALHWESLVASVLEGHQLREHSYPTKLAPLPAWALERLQDQGRGDAASTEFRQQCTMLREAIRLANGEGSVHRYEVWESRQGRRLSIRHESVAEADVVLREFKLRFPEAFVTMVDVRNVHGFQTDPALLDTMLGDLHHVGTYFGCDRSTPEDRFEIQDATGRTVLIEVPVLRAHPAYARLNPRGKLAADHSIERASRQAAAREQGE